MDINDIKNNLSLDEIENLLSYFGADPHRQSDNIIIARTICHGGSSHKLYYYNNTKLFKCYTDCPEDSFDVGQLIIKIKANEGQEMTLPEAVYFLENFFNLTAIKSFEGFFKEETEDDKVLNRYLSNMDLLEKENQIVELKHFDGRILNYLPHPRIIPWEEEGITKEVLNRNNICYNPSNQSIVIPHYDRDNALIGIRERTLIKENEIYGKYRPLYINRQMYNHPLGFNLYNLNNSYKNINSLKTAIVFEGEKSCLKYASLFGKECDISVACCGSSISNYQMKLLEKADVQEVAIAFDKQFQTIGDSEFKKWTKKLTEIDSKYGNYLTISFIFDKWNLLDYKDSPIDKGKDIYLELFKRRFTLYDSRGKENRLQKKA